MILRRITKHVKDQNWFAVALDFFIVVAGILIAFQITNWNEARNDKALTNDYLHRLHADLALSLTSTQATRGFIQRNAERLERSTAWLKSCDLPEEARDDFANSIFHIGKLIPAQFVSDTFDELKASGRLGLLRNVELRKHLSEAAREIEYQDGVWGALHGRAKSSQAYVDLRIVMSFDIPPTGLSTATWDNLETEFTDLCDDPHMLASFSTLIKLSYTNMDWLDRNIENFRNAKKAVEQELGIITPEQAAE